MCKGNLKVIFGIGIFQFVKAFISTQKYGHFYTIWLQSVIIFLQAHVHVNDPDSTHCSSSVPSSSISMFANGSSHLQNQKIVHFHPSKTCYCFDDQGLSMAFTGVLGCCCKLKERPQPSVCGSSSSDSRFGGNAGPTTSASELDNSPL